MWTAVFAFLAVARAASPSCIQAARDACAPWTLSVGCLSCMFAAWDSNELQSGGCTANDTDALQTLCVAPSTGAGRQCAQAMYDSCAPYAAGEACQSCAAEYLSSGCTAELIDDMCVLPSSDLLIALHGSTASASVVKCAKDLVSTCAWGTDSAACVSCGVDMVLPEPGTTCQSQTVASVCALPSNDLADVLSITLPPAPPKSPSVLAPAVPPSPPPSSTPPFCAHINPSQPWENGPAYSNCNENLGEDRYSATQPRYASLEYGADHSNQNSSQLLDLLTTSATSSPDAPPMPLVMFVHGGGWQAGDKCEWEEHLYAIRKRGYQFASTNYRLSQHATYPAQVEDVERAVRHLKTNAATYNIDPERIVLVGSSAGGNLVTLLATRNGPNSTARVAAVVNLYGPTILYAPESAGDVRIPQMLGCSGHTIVGTECYLRAIEASPITHVDAHNPPIITFHGSSDGGFPAAPLFQAAGMAAGAEFTLVVVPCATECHNKATMFAGTTYGRSNVDVMYEWIDYHVGCTVSPGISVGTHNGTASPPPPPMRRRLSGVSSSCLQAARDACAPWTLSPGCLSCIYTAWATNDLELAGCTEDDNDELQAMCVAPSAGAGRQCAQAMYDSCAPYAAGEACQSCAAEYLSSGCTAELIDDMCVLPSSDLLIALHGSTASASVVKCAKDLVSTCAWGTDSAACVSCGVDMVLPEPGTTCQSQTVASVCALPSNDLADVLSITLPPAPPKSPSVLAPAVRSPLQSTVDPPPGGSRLEDASDASGGCGGGCIGGIVGGTLVPMLVLVLWMSGVFAPKCPSPLKQVMQTPKSMAATATSVTSAEMTHVSVTAAEEKI